MVLVVSGRGVPVRHLLRSRAFLRSSKGYVRCFLDRDHIDAGFIRRFVRPLYVSHRRLDGLLHYMRAVDWDVIDGLAEIHPQLDMPSTLVWGAQDETFPVDLARDMVPQFAACEGLGAIDGARLLVHEEQPDAVASRSYSSASATAGAELAWPAAPPGSRVRAGRGPRSRRE